MNRRCLLAMVLLWAPLAAQAQSQFGDRRLAMIEDPLQVTFAGGPGKLTRQQMRQAIELAALVREWRILNVSDERFELSTIRNGKHFLHVVVPYSETGFEIRYVESLDMMYGDARDQGRAVKVIHRNYNAWIRQLAETVSNRIGAPAQFSAPRLPAPQPVAEQPVRQEGPRPAFSTRFDAGSDPDSKKRTGSHRETRDMQ